MRVYLDNCCFNRPYDDQSQSRISLETQAKLYIQNLIRSGQLEMITSYILHYENSNNPFDMRRHAITEFMQNNSSTHIGIEKADRIKKKAFDVMQTGIKPKDAYHVACAMEGNCDYFLTTDDRLLKFKTQKITLLNPISFIKLWEGNDHE